MNAIKHLTMAPYHPVSNGLAERAVQTLKTGLKKMTVGNIEDKLACFLFQYRITPHTTTGQSPAELEEDLDHTWTSSSLIFQTDLRRVMIEKLYIDLM